MVAAEIRKKGSTVRIHDEFCGTVSQECALRLNQIVSNAYQRRMLALGGKRNEAGAQGGRPVLGVENCYYLDHSMSLRFGCFYSILYGKKGVD